jgi:NCS2 family nucleobase:cation symporter-2
MLTALFGGLPTATYSQNVGIVTTNKVVNRTVFTLTGLFLLLAGVCPKFAAVLTTIPQCVLGGATMTVFSTIAMTGMKLITSQTLTARNTTIVGLSAALGVGISQASSALSQFPKEFTIIFGKSPVVIATLMAVLLNVILPKDPA